MMGGADIVPVRRALSSNNFDIKNAVTMAAGWAQSSRRIFFDQ